MIGLVLSEERERKRERERGGEREGREEGVGEEGRERTHSLMPCSIVSLSCFLLSNCSGLSMVDQLTASPSTLQKDKNALTIKQGTLSLFLSHLYLL